MQIFFIDVAMLEVDRCLSAPPLGYIGQKFPSFLGSELLNICCYRGD